jgi:hypothetical protein
MLALDAFEDALGGPDGVDFAHLVPAPDSIPT